MSDRIQAHTHGFGDVPTGTGEGQYPSGTEVAAMISAGFADGFANGTAALPSITFTSDPNTGLYWFAADEIGVALGGAVALVISDTGSTVAAAADTNGQSVTLDTPDGGVPTGALAKAGGYFWINPGAGSAGTALAPGGDGGESYFYSGDGGSTAFPLPGGSGALLSIGSGQGGTNTGGATGEQGGPGGTIQVRGGVGGSTTSTGAHNGGAGAVLDLRAGGGGNAFAGTGAGGAGGPTQITSGYGGGALGGAGGLAGDIEITAGEGGISNGGSDGGNGGSIVLTPGAGGIGVPHGIVGVVAVRGLFTEKANTVAAGTIADAGVIADSQMRGRLLYQDASGGNVTMTTRTGTEIAADYPAMVVGDTIDIAVASNHAVNTSTLAGGLDVTLTGSGAVTNTGGRFWLTKLTATTFQLVRVG
jgi:hypothetical protein